MKQKVYKDLEDKYFEAQTSLEEENVLFDAASNEYFNAIKNIQESKRNTIPNDLNDSIWSEINKRNNHAVIKKISVFAVAASIAILLSVSIFFSQGNDITDKKEISFKEALSMFESKHAVLYEDELIIIYK